MFQWFGPLPFFAVHFACIAAFFLNFHWSYLIVCLALYYVRMFFVTAGYHRYFSHRSFKTSRFFQFVMALMATTSTQKGVLWWAANHLHHHRYSDTEDDAFTFATGLFVVPALVDIGRAAMLDERIDRSPIFVDALGIETTGFAIFKVFLGSGCQREPALVVQRFSQNLCR